MENYLTEEDIRKYGWKARNDFGDITNNCGKIIDRFESYLNDEVGLPWGKEMAGLYRRRELRAGPNGENKHYVFEIDGSLIHGYASGATVLIDLSFDQFNDENLDAGAVNVSFGSRNAVSSEGIRIMTSNDPRFKAQYQTIEAFFESDDA